MSRAYSFQLEAGELEAIKWFALACMLIAHTGRFWYGLESGWPLLLGQMAFPLFSIAVAFPLARDPVAVGERMARRVFWYAVACQLLVQPIRADDVLNVLFTYLCAGVWLASSGEAVQWRRWLLRSLALLVALHSAFWWPGLALIVCLTWWVRTWRLRWLCGAVAAFACIGWLETRWFGFAAVGVVAVVCLLGIRAPRIKNLFARAYVGQYVAYWLARGVL